MSTPVAARTAGVWPLVAVCCLGLIGFLIATTIVLALIPIYIPHKDVTTQTTPDDNNTLYLQYSADANVNTSVSGALENTAALAKLLNLGDDAEVSEAFSQGTFARRRRSVIHRREKRTLKLLILVVVRYKFKATCGDAACQTTIRKKVQTRIQKVGNINSFPCQVRSAGILYTFTVSVTYLGFIPASSARLGFGAVTSLTFVAIQSGPFNDSKTWLSGIIPFGSCYVTIPANITVTLARTVLEIPMQTCEIYGTLAIGSDNSSFKLSYSVNIMVRSGGSIQFLTSNPTLLLPPSSIITVYTGGSFSVTGVIIQPYTSAGLGKGTTLTTASGPITVAMLPDGNGSISSYVLFVVVQNGSILAGTSYLGGIAPSTDACNTSGCGLYIPASYILNTVDCNGVLSIRFDAIEIDPGATLQLGASGSSAGFRFLYAVVLDIDGTLAFLGKNGSGIYTPSSSAVNFYNDGGFTSEVVTFIQAYDTTTMANISDPLVLQTSFSGPNYITISSTGVNSNSTSDLD